MSEETEQLGRYELLRRIAVGGMGEIYLARARGAGGFEKTLIIKKILPHLASDPQFVDKFLDEGRIIVNLSHGNIVPVFDMDEEGGEYYIAMEYVPGRDVRAVLKKLEEVDEAIPPKLACFVISEVCEGLAYAHRQTDSEGRPLEIVHRDVSPSNILLSTDGEVKLIDFGIARAAGRRSETVSGRVQGKVCYMSPEQATGADVDRRSDIFSAGTVLYEMVTGVRPFEGDTDLESLDLVRACDYPSPSELRDDVPDELDVVIERSMTRDPADRYDSADQMQSDLVQILYGGGEAVTSRELASFLNDLFPDGVERQAFKDELSSETDAAAPDDASDDEDGPVDLDDALNAQLEDGRDSRPDPRGRTATLETPSHPDGSDGSSANTDSGSADTPGRPRPASPAGSDAAAVEAGMQPEANGGHVDGRTLLAVGVGLLIAAGLFFVAFDVGGGEEANLTLQTDPAGARILVDGAEIAGARTPHELPVSPGRHTVSFRKDGFRSRTFSVSLEPGETSTLEPKLAAVDGATPDAGVNGGDAGRVAGERDAHADGRAKPRQVQVASEPTGASLSADGERLGTTPLEMTVRADESVSLVARKQGCQPGRRRLKFDGAPEQLTLKLDCPPPAAERAGGAGNGSTDEQRELQITSDPAGASVRIDGEEVGKTPVTKQASEGETLQIALSKSGFENLKMQISPAEVDWAWNGTLTREPKEKGCLNFFAVRPQYNEIAIDGEWLEKRRQKLKGYPLEAGEHKIRVRNEAAGRDETFEFTVEPGDECTSLTVWDPDDDG